MKNGIMFHANLAVLAVLAFLVVIPDAQSPGGTATATFAGGCFWSMEHVSSG
jgi:hypothetical protein